MNSGIRISAVTSKHGDALTLMYEGFEPMAAAFGLPPRAADARGAWIRRSLLQEVNVAAFSPEGVIIGHCFLAKDGPESAELAVFVRQEARRQGIGGALVEAALELARAAGVRRVWTMTAPDNRASLRLQERCGFRATRYGFDAIDMEIALPAAWNAQEAAPAALALTRS